MDSISNFVNCIINLKAPKALKRFSAFFGVFMFYLFTACASTPHEITSSTDTASAVLSFEADIIQKISAAGGYPETYAGRLRAGVSGDLRIDYTLPEPHTLIMRRNRIIWYYPDRAVVKYIDTGRVRGSMENAPVSSAAVLISRGGALPEGYSPEGDGRSSLFTAALLYTMPMQGGRHSRLWVHRENRFILKKIEYDADGREQRREIYSGHTLVGDRYIPSKIEVIIRADGVIVKSTTLYSSVKINPMLDPEIFNPEIPAGVRALNIGTD